MNFNNTYKGKTVFVTGHTGSGKSTTLASMIGVTRESLNRQLRALRERSILRVKRAAGMTYLVVVAPEKLCPGL